MIPGNLSFSMIPQDPCKLMFDQLLLLKQSNAYLVSRILSLFEQHLNLGLESDNNIKDVEASSSFRIPPPATGNHLIIEEESNDNDGYFRMGASRGLNGESAKGGVNGQKRRILYITPNNQSLVIGMLGYLSKAKHQIDTRLLDIVCTLLKLSLNTYSQGTPQSLDFSRGWADPESASQTFLLKFLSGVENTLGNKYLPIKYHAMLTEIMSGGQDNKIDVIVAKVISGETVVKEGTSGWEEWRGIVKMCKYFNPRQTEEVIAKLKQRYQPAEGASMRESLSKHPNKKLVSEIIRVLLLNQNGLVHKQLQSMNIMIDLQQFCLAQINKFLRPRQPGGNGQGFSLLPPQNQKHTFKSIESYLSLLISIFLIHSTTLSDSESNQIEDSTNQNDHQLSEFLAYFFRTALDHNLPLLTQEESSSTIQLILKAIKTHQVYQKNKVELLEVMEILTLFSTNLQLQNQGLVDLLVNTSGNNRGSADKSTSLSQGAHSNHGQSQVVPALIVMNKNIADLGLSQIFEKGILKLIEIESSLDSTFQETSASLKLLNTLVRYLQSFKKNEENIVGCIQFELKLIQILVKNYGVNESIKQAMQAITHKLVKSFEYIVSITSKETVLQILRHLFNLILKEVAREDLTVFLMQEISKLFKKSTFNNIISEQFSEMAESSHSQKDNKTNLHIFWTMIGIINQLWHDQQLSDLSDASFQTLLVALSTTVNKIDMTKGQKTFNMAKHDPKTFQSFLQMWLVIFSYSTEHSKNRVNNLADLIQLASLTPYLVYVGEFSLMLRIGTNKEGLERFIINVFQKFPCLNQVPVSLVQEKKAPAKGEANAKKGEKGKQQQAPQSVVELEDDEDEGEEAELAFGEKLFLALYSQVQEYRMHSLSSQQYRCKLSPAHPNNFIESLLAIVDNDKLESELFVYKLDTLCTYFFDIYLANLKSIELDEDKERILIQDFTYLLKSSCHHQSRLRKLATNFLHDYTQNYPFLLLKPQVMSTFLDLLDSLNTDVYNLYDSLSHIIRLPTTGDQVSLPTRQLSKQAMLKELSSIFTECFVYAEIMSPNGLIMALESYKHLRIETFAEGSKGKHLQWNTTQEMSMSHEPHYGIAFFEYLRSNIDLSKVDFGVLPPITQNQQQNFHSLRNMAATKPWSFVKAVEELKKTCPNGTFFSNFHPDASAGSNPGEAEFMHFHSVFNVMKKQQPNQIERILMLKPFQSPDSGLPKNHTSTSQTLRLYEVELNQKITQMEDKLQLSPGNSSITLDQLHWSASQQVFRDLAGKLLKQAMNLDLYYMLKNIMKLNTKEEVLQILKNLGAKVESQNSSAGSKKQPHLKFSSMINGASRSINHAHGSSIYEMVNNRMHHTLTYNRSTGLMGSPNDNFYGSIIGQNQSQNKLAKTLQKLVHQVNKKQYLNDTVTKMQHIVGLLVALAHRVHSKDLSSKKRIKISTDTDDLSNLVQQILLFLAYVPSLTLCKESVSLLRGTFDLLIINSNHGQESLKNAFYRLLPFSLNISMSKIEPSQTHYETERKVKAFELINQMKREFGEINEDQSSLHELEDLVMSSGYDCYRSLNIEEPFTQKCSSNSSQEQSQKSMLQYISGVLYLIQDLIPVMSYTSSFKNLSPLTSIVSGLFSNLQSPLLHSYATEWFTKTSLLLIKTGLQLIDAQKVLRVSEVRRETEGVLKEVALLESLVFGYIMKYFEKDLFNIEKDNTIEFKEEVQLIKDVKYLLDSSLNDPLTQGQQNFLSRYLASRQPLIFEIKSQGQIAQQFFKLSKKDMIVKRSKVQYIDLGNSNINISAGQTLLIPYSKKQKDSGQPTDFRSEAYFALYLFTQQKQSMLAWNYSEKMKDHKANRDYIELELFQMQDKIKQIISKYPKLSIKLWSRIGTPLKILDQLRIHLKDDILARPYLYQWSTDALEIFLDHVHANKIPPKDVRGVISEWRCWDFVHMIRYLGFRYNGDYFLNQIALKPFEFVKSKTILQYLPQLFQCLRNDSQNQIQRFLINKSKEFASVAHNVLWYCKVESIPDKSKGRKVPLPLRENLPEVVQLLEKNILHHMTPEALQFFDTETEFFERITSISGLLYPKQSKDEKKAVIREKLIEYNKSIPESVYLPTNTNCRVVGIVTNSGAPMQSAARVPIMISFEVEDYPGPDNDPVLTHGQLQMDQSIIQSSNQQIGFQQSLQYALTEPNQNLGGGSRLQSAGRQKSKMSNGGSGVSGNGAPGVKKNQSRRGKLTSRRNLLRSAAELFDKDDESDERLPLRSQENLADDSIDDDFDDRDKLDKKGDENFDDIDDREDIQLQNVSPRHTPAAHIAILNINLQLNKYQFKPSKNETKFMSSFVVGGTKSSQLQKEDLTGPQKNHNRVMSSQQFNIQKINLNNESNNNILGINEEQKVLVDTNQEGASPGRRKQNIEEFYSGRRSTVQALPFSHGKPLDSGSLQMSSPQSQALLKPPKPTVSQLEQRKTLYAPLTELAQGHQSDLQMQAHSINTLKVKNQYSTTQRKRKGTIVQNAERTEGEGARKPQVKVVSCIFKVNDDLRQDIIALQVIKLFQKIFKKCGLDLFVAPYKCISNRTGIDKTLGGVIECVPNSHSRDQLGKAFEIDLYQYFLKRFGSEHSSEFKLARLNFIKSLSSYSVVSYILQIKDRHNGNIMIDDWGHIIHIDFGFIFDWSPGKDMRFESADFKLTKEFIDIVGGDQHAEAYQLYVTKTVQAYLAVRQHYPVFRNLIQLMHLSGFPCFKEHSLQKLEERFRLDLQTELDAANHMRTLIDNAHDKWSTKFYDRIQYLQNKIVF